MKLKILIFSIFVLSCHGPAQQPIKSVWDSSNVIHETSDTVATLADVRSIDTSGCKHTIDSLKTALFLSEFKVTKVRKYLNICLHNPSQDKFLKGWIKRAIQ
jgi:hypothetical protein